MLGAHDGARSHLPLGSRQGHATGASAFDSAPFVLAGDNTMHDATVNTGAVVLPAGTYVIFLSTSQDPQPDSECEWGTAPDATYAGGSFVWFNNATDTSLWTSTTWDGLGFPGDASFAVFFAGSDVPTMPEWVLMIVIAMTTLTAAWALRRSGGRLALSH